MTQKSATGVDLHVGKRMRDRLLLSHQ